VRKSSAAASNAACSAPCCCVASVLSPSGPSPVSHDVSAASCCDGAISTVSSGISSGHRARCGHEPQVAAVLGSIDGRNVGSIHEPPEPPADEVGADGGGEGGGGDEGGSGGGGESSAGEAEADGGGEGGGDDAGRPVEASGEGTRLEHAPRQAASGDTGADSNPSSAHAATDISTGSWPSRARSRSGIGWVMSRGEIRARSASLRSSAGAAVRKSSAAASNAACSAPCCCVASVLSPSGPSPVSHDVSAASAEEISVRSELGPSSAAAVAPASRLPTNAAISSKLESSVPSSPSSPCPL